MADESRDRSVSQAPRVADVARTAAALREMCFRNHRTASCVLLVRAPGTLGWSSPRQPTRLRQAEHAKDIQQTSFLFLSGFPFQPCASQRLNLTQVHLHSCGSQEQPEAPGATRPAPGTGYSTLAQHEATVGGRSFSASLLLSASINAKHRCDGRPVSMAFSAKIADGITLGDSKIAGTAL